MSSDSCMIVECSSNVCMIDENIVERINRDTDSTWRAANYSQFWGKTLEDGIQGRLGARWPDYPVGKYLISNMN